MKLKLEPFKFIKITFPLPEKPSFSGHIPKGFIPLLVHSLKRWRDPSKKKAEKCFNQGLRHFGFGFFADARTSFNECLELQPDHVPALLNDGATAFYLGLEEEAQERWHKVLSIYPQNNHALFNLAAVCMHHQQFDRALGYIDRVLQIQPDHTQAILAKSEIAFNRNQIDETIRGYQKVFSKPSIAHLAHTRCAELFQLQGHYAEAEKHTRLALEKHAEAELLFNLGWLLAQQNKNLDEAIRLFAEAHRKRTGMTEASINQALVLSFSGEFEKSVKLARKIAYRIDPAGKAFESLVQRLVQINPQNQLGLLALAKIKLEKHQIQQAIRLLSQGVHEFPENNQFFYYLCVIQMEQGQFTMAEKTVKKWLATHPDDIAAFGILGRIRANQNDFAQATLLLERALEGEPNETEILYNLGLMYAQASRWEEALTKFERVFDLEPNFPKIQTRIRSVKDELEPAIPEDTSGQDKQN